MALIKCKGCGKEISKKAKVCPECGEPVPKKTSIATWLVLIMFILIVVNYPDEPTLTESKQSQYKNKSLEIEKKAKEIPRSTMGDKGKYFLIDTKKLKNTIQVTHMMVGSNSTVYTKSEINCKNMQIRVLGESFESLESINDTPTKWFGLVKGSSKSDLVNFVCKMYEHEGV